MAIIKHISVKNSNYDAAADYLVYRYDELTHKPILDENGEMIMRENFLISGINCDPYTFARECEAVNAAFHKNQSKTEIKAHHYIISFDPRDRDENALTLGEAQALCMDFAARNFPGHQALVCAHPDGHHSSGNIHVHIVINSVRKLTVERREFMERPGDMLAGMKHNVTKKFLAHLKQQTMSMCQERSLYQVDLLSPAKVRITDREYYAALRGEGAYLDDDNADAGSISSESGFKTDKEILRAAIRSCLADSLSYETFTEKLFESYGISVGESRGKINYLLPDKNRPVRGRALGADFEKEHIMAVIEENLMSLSPGKYTPSVKFITDLESCVKAQESTAYARKVKIGNLKKMADTLAFVREHGIDSIETLDELIAASGTDLSKKRTALKSTEAELARVNLLIKNTGQYLTNRDTYRRYLRSDSKKDFREAHRAELSLYEAARNYLRENYPAKEKSTVSKSQNSRFTVPNLKLLKTEKAALTSRKNREYENYSYAKAKQRELMAVKKNVGEMVDFNRHADKEFAI